MKTILLGAAAVTAASYIVEVAPGQDVTFLSFMLLGPVLTGVVLAIRRADWRPGAAAWSIAALGWLVTDWVINHEDVLFHAVIAVLFVGLVALGAGSVRAARAVV